jgi:hypothetical protein
VDTEQMMELKEQMQRKYPYFFRIRALTFLKKLEFLLKAGYVPHELMDYPHIFYCKISTVNKVFEGLLLLFIESLWSADHHGQRSDNVHLNGTA